MIHSDRRRITFAVILTLLAFPAMWAANRQEPPATTTAAAGVAAPTPITDAPPDTFQPAEPVFLGGDAPPPAPVVIEIDSPPPSDGHAFDGKATFRRFGDATNAACSTNRAPASTALSVTNTDNGLVLTCFNTAAVDPPEGTDIVVNTDLLATICDLVNAPVHVRVSW